MTVKLMTAQIVICGPNGQIYLLTGGLDIWIRIIPDRRKFVRICLPFQISIIPSKKHF